jgi:hypothetical protein
VPSDSSRKNLEAPDRNPAPSVSSPPLRPSRVHPAIFPAPLLLIAAAALAMVLPFLFLGNPSGHDFEFHMNSWMEVVRQWKSGILYPHWAALAHFGFGEPRFIFYPPISWWLGSLLGLILPWKMVSGAYIFLALGFSGYSMFLLARRWLDRLDAAFAAVLYAANPYHFVIVYWRSAFAELLAAALLPLLLLAVLRLYERGRSGIAPLALVIAAVWLINAPAGVMVNYSLVLLLVLLAISERSSRLLWQGALALALGLGLAAFYLIPATYEQPWVNIMQAVSPGARPQDNYLLTRVADPLHDQFNLLISIVALAGIVAVLAAALRWRRWRTQMPDAWWLLAAWTGLAALLMFSPASFLWDHLPKLRFVQFPWRWLLCFNLGFALLITLAWRRWLARSALIFAMAAALAFVWIRVQPPWWDTAADVAELADNIQTAAGYEGTDEYAPLKADPYSIPHDAPPAVFQGVGEIQILRWQPELKSLSVRAHQPGPLLLKLFVYPAWKLTVNGQVKPPETQPHTGQMMIPLPAGENRVDLRFIRTPDRTAGACVSLASVIVLLLAAGKNKKWKIPS